MTESFILYTEYIDYTDKLTDSQCGVLMRAILAYQTDRELPEMDALTDMAFTVIRNDMRRNSIKYEQRCKENRENGKKGGRPKKTATVTKQEKEPVQTPPIQHMSVENQKESYVQPYEEEKTQRVTDTDTNTELLTKWQEAVKKVQELTAYAESLKKELANLKKQKEQSTPSHEQQQEKLINKWETYARAKENSFEKPKKPYGYFENPYEYDSEYDNDGEYDNDSDSDYDNEKENEYERESRHTHIVNNTHTNEEEQEEKESVWQQAALSVFDSVKEKGVQDSYFEKFWEEYPRKVGKQTAREAWSEIAPNSSMFEKIIQSVKKAKTCYEWQKEDGRFIPHPVTWLKREGWEDEYIQNPPKQNDAQKNTQAQSYMKHNYTAKDLEHIGITFDD